jgi:hypothetical protein
MSPIYSYKNPKTGEIFDEIRLMKDSNIPFVLDDGTECERVLFPSFTKGPAIIDVKREVFQADPELVKKTNPKYVRFKDGHKERYDPTKHC